MCKPVEKPKLNAALYLKHSQYLSLVYWGDLSVCIIAVNVNDTDGTR